MHVLIAPDKFKGTMTAVQAADAMARGLRSFDVELSLLPLADGGEGTVQALGGMNRRTLVHGPLGEEVIAGWRMSQSTAVIEMAAASGLMLMDGSRNNDPMLASSQGTGELIAAAIDAGATRIIVGAGGSACTDGGLAAVEVLKSYGPLDGSRGVEVIIATDVQTRFLDAAFIFAPQKGATKIQVDDLTQRLRSLADDFRFMYGVDVTHLPGSGAAGGFAGGMAALGARLKHGFDLVAEEIGLQEAINRADLVLTGEGFVDEASFNGKVVGSVIHRAKMANVPVCVIAGRIDPLITRDFLAVSLVERFGTIHAMTSAVECVESATAELVKLFLESEDSWKENCM